MFLNEIEVQTEWRLNAPSVQHENFLLAKKLKLSAQKRFLFDNATWRFRQRAPLSLSLSLFFFQTNLFIFLRHSFKGDSSCGGQSGATRSSFRVFQDRDQAKEPTQFRRPAIGRPIKIVEGE